jgi:Cu2+-exporting ATPase
MIDEAKLSKPKLQDITDRVTSYFVPVVVNLTVITLVIWIAIGVAVRKQFGAKATIQAVMYAITVLIISCPCVIGLAFPIVIIIVSGIAAERGVIFKSADSIQVAYKTAHVVFNKTGTLTQGKLNVAVEEHVSSSPSSSTSLLLGLVSNINHPVFAAVTAHLKAKGVLPSAVSDPKTLTGKGVEGTASSPVLRAETLAGLTSLLIHASSPSSHKATQPSASPSTTQSLPCSVWRTHSAPTLSLPSRSCTNVTFLFTSSPATTIAPSALWQLSWASPDAYVRSRCTPADKQVYIQDLLATQIPKRSTKKSKKPVVIFCGDETNDAVALAQATISVHMNKGTDVAKSTADIVLMRPSLAGILTIIAISKKSVNRIKFNFG